MTKMELPSLGHVMRKDSIENLSWTGKVVGKRARDRQKVTFLDNVKNWSNNTNGSDLIHACQDKEVRKHMIVDTLGHDTLGAIHRLRHAMRVGVF